MFSLESGSTSLLVWNKDWPEIERHEGKNTEKKKKISNLEEKVKKLCKEAKDKNVD